MPGLPGILDAQGPQAGGPPQGGDPQQAMMGRLQMVMQVIAKSGIPPQLLVQALSQQGGEQSPGGMGMNAGPPQQPGASPPMGILGPGR